MRCTSVVTSQNSHFEVLKASEKYDIDTIQMNHAKKMFIIRIVVW
jgi:hypothetical protein